ncbi:MAG: hypothetical protein KDE56_13160 [Anaerolineales bacterium]|nr:hypothetical protein [Anaerolineales bacterium]
MDDVAQVLREQIRVTRPGGAVSAVTCFCHTDGLPDFNGRFPLPHNRRLDHLTHKLWTTFRRHVRPALLNADLEGLTQELAWEFRRAGLQEITINGHLAVVSPGDDRLPLDEAIAYMLARRAKDWQRLQGMWAQHEAAMIAAGFSQAEFAELTELVQARDAYLQADPSRVREVMEVFTDALFMVRGKKHLDEAD